MIKFEITRSNPEKAAERLAVKLAEAYHNASVFDKYAVDFQRSAQVERQKAKEAQTILMGLDAWHKQLEEDRANGIERKISRMEPMLSYDVEALKAQIENNKANANTFHKKADSYTKQAEEARKEISRLQVEIADINKKKKK